MDLERQPDEPANKRMLTANLITMLEQDLAKYGIDITEPDEDKRIYYKFIGEDMFHPRHHLLLDRVDDEYAIHVISYWVEPRIAFTVVKKPKENVLPEEADYYRILCNLRYKISTGTSLELTEGNQVKFNEFRKDFNRWVKALCNHNVDELLNKRGVK